jgi:hypothetical protein
MNSSSRRSTRENAIDKVAVGPESNSKAESIIISHNEALINRASTFSDIDNDVQNPCSNFGLSGKTAKKRNSCARRKASVINKKKSVVLRPLVNAKKISKNRLPMYVKVKEEQVPSREITLRIEDLEEKIDTVTAYHESPKFYQVRSQF